VIQPSGLIFSLNPVDNQSFAYYCFSFSARQSDNQVQILFELSSDNPDLYIELDDIALNSSLLVKNFIGNGGFEKKTFTEEWTVKSCQSCDTGVDNLHAHTGDLSFYASGVGVTLNQTIALVELNDQPSQVTLSFWTAYECGGNNQCSIGVRLVTG
jgi:hypothetical protein